MVRVKTRQENSETNCTARRSYGNTTVALNKNLLLGHQSRTGTALLPFQWCKFLAVTLGFQTMDRRVVGANYLDCTCATLDLWHELRSFASLSPGACWRVARAARYKCTARMGYGMWTWKWNVYVGIVRRDYRLSVGVAISCTSHDEQMSYLVNQT